MKYGRATTDLHAKSNMHHIRNIRRLFNNIRTNGITNSRSTVLKAIAFVVK